MKKIFSLIILSLSLFSSLSAEVNLKFGWPLTFAFLNTPYSEYKVNDSIYDIGFDFGYTYENKNHFGYTSELTTYFDPSNLSIGFNIFVGLAYSIPLTKNSGLHFDAGYSISYIEPSSTPLTVGGKGIQVNTAFKYFFNKTIGVNIGLKNSFLFINQAVPVYYKYPSSTKGDFYTHVRERAMFSLPTFTYELSPSIGFIIHLEKSDKKEPRNEE